MNRILILLMAILALSLFFWSCGSDDGSTEPTNQSPTCTVASPSPYSGFFKGDTISVKVNVDDQDGDIKEVRYFLDGIGEYSTQTFPYSADIATQDLQLGGHLIKIVAEDDAGAETDVELPFGIKPQNPTNLQISQNNVYTFTLNWTNNDANADGFKIERKIDNDPFVEIKTTTATTFIDSTVAKKGFGTVYYQLRAYKDIYNSDYASNSFAIAFPSPSNLTYTKLNLNTIRLNWIDSSTGEEGFRIDKKVGNNDWIISFGSVNENALNWTDSLAEINQTLQYRVYAYKGLNTSGSIETSSFSNQFPTPTNLNIVQSSITMATISFTDNSKGEDKFQIERKLSTEDSYTLIKEILGSDTSSKTWIDSTTTPNLTYDYRVKGVKGSFESSYITKTGYKNLFNAPTSFTIMQNNVYTFTLNWSDSNIGEDGFKIERKIDDGLFSEIATTTQTNYIDNTVAKKGFVTVYYQIRAYKNTYFTNYTSNSSSVSFPAPTNLTFTKESISSIRLNWTDNSTGEDGFIIDKKIGAAEWLNGFASVSSNTVTWTDNNAEINQSLTYRIHAYKGTNTSATSTTSVIDNSFPAPTGLTATQNNVYTFTLNWTDNSIGEDGFKIERKIDDGAFSVIATVSGTSYIDNTVSKGFGTVYYQVRAYKGTVYFSNYATTNLSIYFPPPTNLTATQTSLTSVSLVWSDNCIGEEKFEIERKLSSESSYIKIAEVTGNDTATKSWSDSGTTPNLSYDYRIKAVKGLNYSDFISTTFVNRLSTPSNFVLSVENSSVIKLYWEDNTIFEDGFKIDKKIGESGTWIADYATVVSNITSFTDTGLSLGTTYYYKIRAYYQGYFSEYTEVVSQTCNIIEVPSGTFNMGDVDAFNATPVHTVNITRPFYLGKYEVTQKEWESIMGYNPADNSGIGDFFPVYRINWYEVMVYCNKRSIQEKLTPCYSIKGTTDPQLWGAIPVEPDSAWDAVICDFTKQGYRLPTEAEWEYAARYNDGRTYPWGETEPSELLCNYDGNVGATTVVGSYPAGNSYLGFCDMAGNAHEWIWDSFDSYYYQYCVDNNIVDYPTGTTRSITRVLRGGSLGVNSNILSAYRSWILVDGDDAYVVSFRVARTK